MFGDSAAFEVDGNGEYNTFVGTLISILFFILIVPYGVNKYLVMVEYNNTNYGESIITR